MHTKFWSENVKGIGHSEDIKRKWGYNIIKDLRETAGGGGVERISRLDPCGSD
jgi:hypothetical protein